GSALVAFPGADTTRDRLILMGSFLEPAIEKSSNDPSKNLNAGNRVFSFLFEWNPGTSLWEARPVFDGWQQFQGQNFYMQAVVFNRFLFCWSLQNDAEFRGKLKLLVS